MDSKKNKTADELEETEVEEETTTTKTTKKTKAAAEEANVEEVETNTAEVIEFESVTEQDYNIVEYEENKGYFILELKKTIQYEGKTFDKIEFDFEALNGRDLLAIEDEMARKNKISIGIELSKMNQYLLAVRAANKAKGKNGFTVTGDLLECLPISDFNKVCRATRDFFTE